MHTLMTSEEVCVSPTGVADVLIPVLSGQGARAAILLSARLGQLHVLRHLWNSIGNTMIDAIDAPICAMCAELNNKVHWKTATHSRLHEPLQLATPLIAAACGGHLEVVEFLLKDCMASVNDGDEVRPLFTMAAGSLAPKSCCWLPAATALVHWAVYVRTGW